MNNKDLSPLHTELKQLLAEKHPGQPEYHQAVEETLLDLIPYVLEQSAQDQTMMASTLKRLIEPDRIIQFRVSWQDDLGKMQHHRGYRVQHCNVLGPYKGGIRFHPSVTQSVLKFLAYEQTIKNSLTGLPIGGGKGGANFDPKGRSDGEIKRFCQAFIQQLAPFIGPYRDVPAGDIGVGSREIGYMYGMYKQLTQQHLGSLTGRIPEIGGSLFRPEATGFGCIYLLNEALAFHQRQLAHQDVLISGSGVVALYAAEKCLANQARVMSLSDSNGLLLSKEGFSFEDISKIKRAKLIDRARLKDIAAGLPGVKYLAKQKPWQHPGHIAIPCATQNEIDEADAKSIRENGVYAVIEGANMPVTQAAIEQFEANDILYIPGKIGNCGGVIVSTYEMSQNACFSPWSQDQVDEKLKAQMRQVHQLCQATESKTGVCFNYRKTSNIAGFLRVHEAHTRLGV